MFIFVKGPCSSAAETLYKYEHDILQVTSVLVVLKKEEITEQRKLA